MTGSVANSPSFPSISRKRRRRRNAESEFETMATALGVDLSRMDPQVVSGAIATCTQCDSRDACRRWLRNGVWSYDGDPRCPNIALLRQ